MLAAVLLAATGGRAQTAAPPGAPPAIRQATTLIVRGQLDAARARLDTHLQAHPRDAWAVLFSGCTTPPCWIELRRRPDGDWFEAPFATVRLRQRVTKGAGSRQKGLLMAFQLLAMAERRWRRINAPHLVPLVRDEGMFRDGAAVERRAPSRAA